MRRAWLVPAATGTDTPNHDTRFELDALVGDDGSNFSAGERQLVALCRALAKDSKIIVMVCPTNFSLIRPSLTGM